MKNKILKGVKIEKVGFGWVWICTLEDNKKLIVSWWVLPWSVVDVKITKRKKDFLKWQIIWYVSYDISNLKEWNVCKHLVWLTANSIDDGNIWCGWCKRQVLSYEEQVKLKHDIILECFRNTDIEIWDIFLWVEHSPKIYGYRNKIEFSFGKFIKKEGIRKEWQLWFHKQWEFSKVVNVSKCLLIEDEPNKIYDYLRQLFVASGLPVHDNYTHEWFFRHLVIRMWQNTWQTLINLSINTNYLDKNVKDLNKWLKLEKILQNDEYLKSVVDTFVITENNWLADVVKWNDITTKNLVWWWYIYEKLNIKDIAINFRISAFSFFQTNTIWAEKLFEIWVNMIWKNKWTILDLYCGAWAIWIICLKTWLWNKLLWVDIVQDSISDAQVNAKINWIEDKSYFVAGKAETTVFDNTTIKDCIKDISLVIVDPPRDWLHKDLLKFLTQLKQQTNYKLLYISCNPVSLARDLQILHTDWFKISKIQWMDMFPHTHHIELVSFII